MGDRFLKLPLSVEAIEQFLMSRGFTASYSGPPDVEVNGFSDPGCYEPGTAIWLGAVKYLELGDNLTREDVTLLFASPEFDAMGEFPAIMLCDDPRNAFMSLVEASVREEVALGVHETAVIEPGAILGSGVSVGSHAVIESGARIGEGSVIESGAVVRSCVSIGSNCRVFPNCVIGSPGYGFRKSCDGALRRLPHTGGVVIGDDVEIGAGTVIDRGTFRDTRIGSGTKIDSLTTIGHNVQVGRNCLVIGGAIGGNSSIGDGCEIIHACVKNRVNVGCGSRIGIGSVVIKDVEEDVECFGNPARVIRK